MCVCVVVVVFFSIHLRLKILLLHRQTPLFSVLRSRKNDGSSEHHVARSRFRSSKTCKVWNKNQVGWNTDGMENISMNPSETVESNSFFFTSRSFFLLYEKFSVHHTYSILYAFCVYSLLFLKAVGFCFIFLLYFHHIRMELSVFTIRCFRQQYDRKNIYLRRSAERLNSFGAVIA